MNPGQTKLDAILIDDDVLIHMTWKASARRHGKRFAAFTSSDLFFERANEYAWDTALFIDSNLGDGMKGEEVAKELRARGFSEIYLATGYDRSHFAEMPWIRGIVGKDPVWDE